MAKQKAMRPTWEGHLRLSLVTCPVALYTATERTADIHFNMINPRTNNRIRMQTVDAGTGKPVDRADLVRGFAVSKNKYVLLEKEELDAVRLESTRILDIEEFVDATEIDRIYWDEPYYLAPSGKTGIEAYAVIRAAMEKRRKVALGRVVMHQRERICALEPRDKGILLTTLRTHDEIRATSEVFDRSLPRPNAQMLQIAEKIIEQQDARFDPTRFKDRYEDALRELIAKKKKGQPVVSEAPEQDDEKVVDLMEALKKSLKGGGGPSRDKADRFLEAHGRSKAKPKAKAKTKTRHKAVSRKRAA
ncbi:MAG: Ku protein [Reyranella sp.]|uniref:non-homologous end joining protein Ku n=1 Tax=Reyranella sp. TaxID=1929291 RepID=UPI001209CE6F|nr:Ku protein [Reyranella sp.]TAJ86461.1 MAG: Ku protein [Reyranella sp.]TBR22252.1 MAG: Ku protein [Reyranella sp.]